MSFSKAHLFPDSPKELAKICKSFSHPARIQIFKLLSKENLLCSAQLAENMPISQTTLSDHLGILRDVGYVEYEIQNGIPFYRLNHKEIPLWMNQGLQKEIKTEWQ